MGQLLVVEKALLAVELDEADFPAYALEEMQDRFMTKDSRPPISWSLKLRAYGKAIKDNTTSLGYIMWSDDNETLSYKKNAVLDDWTVNDKEARKERKKVSRILRKLTTDKAETDSVAAVTSDGPWSATRLSVTLTRAFKLTFGTDTNIQMWRHAAIAISRRHLQQAKFKRDFIEAVSWAWNDEMAAHSTKIAGLTYARGLEKAPGHIASAKAELWLRGNKSRCIFALMIFESQQEVQDNLPPRPDDAPPIAALGPPGAGGIRCEFIPERSTSSQSDCPYVGTELRRIREHLRIKHNWDMELKGGRRSAAMTEEERSNDIESLATLQRAIDAFQSKGKDIRNREAERIDAENGFQKPPRLSDFLIY
ncbi:telomere-associated helicase [Fusarium beomiforme]|uniref:Telomere-associated helicase n=1 Tax=Fusarium beomiforme TaxID=44412 RepID=A0A9P5AD42_9HYPO|nr:telomere-associated helicase [Fusarium beomiforme]